MSLLGWFGGAASLLPCALLWSHVPMLEGKAEMTALFLERTEPAKSIWCILDTVFWWTKPPHVKRVNVVLWKPNSIWVLVLGNLDQLKSDVESVFLITNVWTRLANDRIPLPALQTLIIHGDSREAFMMIPRALPSAQHTLLNAQPLHEADSSAAQRISK
ncbi:hypothetical protein PENSPDRAFT_694658 [Peniophora sp. CONT]|nr:hypothetical protein PENSPDRAFT_694658 [Peniophora sp. CONT]